MNWREQKIAQESGFVCGSAKDDFNGAVMLTGGRLLHLSKPMIWRYKISRAHSYVSPGKRPSFYQRYGGATNETLNCRAAKRWTGKPSIMNLAEYDNIF